MNNEKKAITVSVLKAQLEELERMGMGNFTVWYRDYTECDLPFESGVWDVNRKCDRISFI